MKHLRGLFLPCILPIAVAMFVPTAYTQELTKQAKATASDTSYVVILKNGNKVPARTKPVIAFGKVRYMEPGGTNRVLAASEVDIDKTRTANAKAPSKTSGGTLSVGGGMANYKPTKAGGSSPAPAKSVKVYSATWCRYCTELKKFLAENGISASVTEVDTLPEAAQQKAHAEMKRLTGKTSFPTVVVGNGAMAGFSPKWILQTLKN